MPQNTESEPVVPVIAEADRAVEVTGVPGEPAELPSRPGAAESDFAAVTP
ncbi:hypothetical protein [Streptomyces phaeoluteigriseus]